MYRHQTLQHQLILPLVTNNLCADSFMTSTQYYIKKYPKEVKDTPLRACNRNILYSVYFQVPFYNLIMSKKTC